jgi:hypothetical protein
VGLALLNDERPKHEAKGRWCAIPASHFKTRQLNHMQEALATANAVVWVENSSPLHFFREVQVSTRFSEPVIAYL